MYQSRLRLLIHVAFNCKAKKPHFLFFIFYFLLYFFFVIVVVFKGLSKWSELRYNSAGFKEPPNEIN